MSSLHAFASSRAHYLLSQLIDSGVVAPTERGGIVASAKSEVHKLQVIVTIAEFEPPTISADTLAKIEALKSPDLSRLKPLQKKILAVLEGQPARKATWIAIRLGKKTADGNLRTYLADLLRMRLLVKGADGFGYQLATMPSDSRAAAS